MKLSQTGRQFRENVTWGFIPVEVNPSSETELLGVLRCDWSPFLFKGNTRIGENFVSCDCLLMDIDNTDGEKCSIDSFETIFRDTQYIISTSRNHQKTKMYGPGKTLESQPQDRFHVLFPLSAVFTDATLLTASLHALIKKYPFFDKAVSGPAQLVFANPHTILKINSGKEIDIPPVEFTVKIVNKQSFNEWESSINEHDFLKNKTNRVKLLRALQNTASEGGFDNRTDWIRCGMALKKEGFTAQDFASISWDEAMDDAMAQFESFNPERVTAGTLIYFAKQSTKLSFLSEEQEQLIEEGNQILQGWKKNAQEEKAKLLAERKPQAVAGPAPDNFMPPDGLIKEVSEYILSTSIRPLRGLAIASAVSLISVLIGRKYETPTGL
jgi:hypothetical protein